MALERLPRRQTRCKVAPVSGRVVLAVAGNIGSGKTTLTRRLAQRLALKGLFEPLDENPYMSDFYGDMPRWALPVQLRFLVARVRQVRDAIGAGVSAVQDRTCWEDAEIFAANLHARGEMDQRDCDTYRMVASEVLAELPPPDLLVYLRREAPGCHAQIAKRGREYEASIPLPYLEDLGARYDAFYEGWSRSLKLLVRAEDNEFLERDDDLEALVRRIEAALPQPTLPFGD